MKHKTWELDGSRLDSAVALAADVILVFENFERLDYSAVNELDGRYYKPSVDWRVGGLIIASHWQDIRNVMEHIHGIAWPGSVQMAAPNTLKTLMRAFVASKFGDEVDLS